MNPAIWSCELGARLRERKVWAVAAFFLVSVLAAPGLLRQPPEHLISAITAWFGPDARFGLFMYLWTDMAMNKAAVLTGAALGSGVVVHEASRRSLSLWLSRPIGPSGFFALRAGSAAAVAAGLYAITHILALPWFQAQIPDFRPGDFLLSGLVHGGVVVWSVLVSAAIAVATGRQLVGATISVVLLFALVGAAFLGVYDPSLAGLTTLNPFSAAIAGVARLERLGPATVAGPIATLLAFNLVTLGLGAWIARKVEP